MPLSPLITDLDLAYRWRAPSRPGGGLLILLHGVGSNENSLLGLADFLPDECGIAFVRFPLQLAPGAYAAFAVNFTADGPRIDAAAAEASRRQLIGFIAELQGRYGVAPLQTLIAGFSQGGIMSASVALTSPASVAGFAILSGRILPEIAPHIASTAELAHLQALIVHGSADDRLPAFWADRAEAQLQALGIVSECRRYSMGHEVTPAVASDFAAWVRLHLPDCGASQP